MDQNSFITQQFAALRREIESQQARLFWIVVIGLLGVPTLTHVVWSAGTLVWLALPFFVLVLILLFLAQQSQMMRAGRYVREHIENRLTDMQGWESWLESRSALRLMDRHFSACFIVIFFAYYFLSIGMAIHRLWMDAVEDPSGLYWRFVYCAGAVYAIATIWAIATLFWHWKSSTSTTAPLPNKHLQSAD